MEKQTVELRVQKECKHSVVYSCKEPVPTTFYIPKDLVGYIGYPSNVVVTIEEKPKSV